MDPNTNTPSDQDGISRMLTEPFDPSEIRWKPGATNREKTKGLAMGYLTSRAIQTRLDETFGPFGWRNEFRPGPDGGVVCGISARVVWPDGSAEWVTKWDGADNTDVEGTKGGLSGSMKRAAVVWGIGRYLYSLPAQWVPLDDRGRIVKPPDLPPAYLPGRKAARASQRPDPQDRARAEAHFHAVGAEWAGLVERDERITAAREWDAQRPFVIEGYAVARDLTLRSPSTNELPLADLIDLTRALRARIDAGTGPEQSRATLPTRGPNARRPEERPPLEPRAGAAA